MKENQNKRYSSKKNSKKAPKGGEIIAVVPDKFAHIEPVQAQPLEVKVYGNNFDKALRAFRALVQKERILSTYKENQSYEKPSDKKRRKRNEMRRKRLELDSAPKEFKKRTRSRDSSE
jgi:small subunit ribosomal protein S21